MADIIVESVPCDLWLSKLNLLESQYQNTRLLVNQDTLVCQKWKCELDLLFKEEQLHQQSRNICKLRRTVGEAHRLIKKTREKSDDDKKTLETNLKIETEQKLCHQETQHKQEKDTFEKEIRNLKEMKNKMELEFIEVEKRLLSEGDQMMSKLQKDYDTMRKQLCEDVKTWKEKHEKVQKEIDQLQLENSKNILAKEKMEEEIKIIRRTLKTETDEKLIQHVEKSTKEKCHLTNEIKEWRDKHAEALTEIENLRSQLMSKNVKTKVKFTQTQVTKMHNKGISVYTEYCETGCQTDNKMIQTESMKESAIYSAEEKNGVQITSESCSDMQIFTKKRDHKGKKNSITANKTNKASLLKNEDQSENVVIDDLAQNEKDFPPQKEDKSQLDKHKKSSNNDKDGFPDPNDKRESTTAVSSTIQKQRKQIEKPPKEKSKQIKKRKNKASKENKSSENETMKGDNYGDLIMEEEMRDLTNQSHKKHIEKTEELKTFGKRKEHSDDDEISLDASAAKRSRSNSSDDKNGQDQDISYNGSEIDKTNMTSKNASSVLKSPNCDKTMGKHDKSMKNQRNGTQTEKYVSGNVSILTKPPLYRPSTSSIRHSTAADLSSVLSKTKPPVYRPSMSIRQSSASDVSSVLNGTKRRTLYNSKGDNSLMVSMLPLQESFMNSTISRGKKSNGAMPASLSSFLKSFTAPKLKKNTAA